MPPMLSVFIWLLALPLLAAADNHMRIINGNPASSAPYQARISIKIGSSESFCGGAILSESYILTAAQCCNNPNQQGQSVDATYTITAGTLLRSSGGVSRTADQLYIHPYFNGTDLSLQRGYDLCVLHLSSPLPLSSTIAAIQIAFDYATPGKQVRVTGWGSTMSYTTANESLGENLQEAMLTVGHVSEMEDWFKTKQGTVGCYPVADIAYAYHNLGIFATGFGDSPLPGICQGDLGGPVAINYSFPMEGINSLYLVGIVSHGFGCGQASSLTVYASTVNSEAWINQIMNGGSGITLCNGRTCGPGAECSASTCVCKAGFYKTPGYDDLFGFTCRRWLNGGAVQTLDGYRLLYELVPTSSSWDADIIRAYGAPQGVSNGLTQCGYTFYPTSAAEASLVASQLTSYLSTAEIGMPPNNRIWTAVGERYGNWSFYLSQSIKEPFNLNLWASGEPADGWYAAMIVSGSNASQLDAMYPDTMTWFIIRYAAPTSGNGGTGITADSSAPMLSVLSIPLLLATAVVFLLTHV